MSASNVVTLWQYRERSLMVKLIIQYIEILLYAAMSFTVVIFINVQLFSKPQYASQLVILYFVIPVITFYVLIRARWIWSNTFLVANKGKVWIERPGSILFMAFAKIPSLRSKGVDYFVLKQRLPDLLLIKLLRIESWTVSLDTAADEKGDLKSLKYVKDAQRLRNTVHPDE
jgi:hypothetical protein